MFEKIDMLTSSVPKLASVQFGRRNISLNGNRTATIIFFNGVDRMTDPDDLKLKAEIDEIMKVVDCIMTKVETVMPAKQEEAQPQSDGSNIS